MPDIDLIPEDYRSWLLRQSMLKRFAITMTVFLSAVLLLGGIIGEGAKRAQTRVAQLKSQNAITQQQHVQLELLSEEQAEYERQWSLLRGLRAGAAAEDVFSIIDAALNEGDLWFTSLKFRRAGVIVDGEQRGVETGYFIVVPADERQNSNADWHVETHMTIQGQAKDHQALSTFVRSLFEQPDIKYVNVQKTTLTDYANGRVVSFDLTIVLNSALRDS